MICRDLYKHRAFISDYTSITTDGSQWLIDHTDWHLIGIDYLGVSTYEDCTPGHQLMLGKVRHRVCRSCMGSMGRHKYCINAYVLGTVDAKLIHAVICMK